MLLKLPIFTLFYFLTLFSPLQRRTSKVAHKPIHLFICFCHLDLLHVGNMRKGTLTNPVWETAK